MPSAQEFLHTANTHARAGRFHDAAACLEDAARLFPADPAIWVSLGMMRSTSGNIATAETAFLRAAELDPANVDAHMYLGIILAIQQRAAEADTNYRRALALAPHRSDIAHAYSRLLADTARTEEALAIIRSAQHHNPNDPSLQDKVCCLLNYLPDHSPEDVLAAHERFGQLVGAPPPTHRITNFNPDRPLRIGYLSGDLREHSVSYFLEPLLEHHDPARFSIYAYHVGPPDDKATPRLRARIPNYRHLFPISDDALAAAIAADEIDILVELAGHAQGNRLTAVSRKPAPVIATYIGYPNTTGIPAVNFRIVDALTDPPGADRWCTETLVRLNRCFLCYRAYSQAPEPRPRDPDRPLTFASFNNLAKLSNPTLDLWGRLLARTPGARLALKGRGLGDDSVRTRILSRLTAAGIAADRVELAGHTATTPEHLAQYHAVDIALDPFPYAGTTTTCESLHMGVPVVSLAGTTHASRVGVSLLTAVGLPELIAESQDHYLSIAAELASDPPRLATLRASLRARLLASPLCDARAHTAAIEAAYRTMWIQTVPPR